MTGPILFCYDGSEGSQRALRDAVGSLDKSIDAVVLTVWEPTAVVLARSAPFGPITIGQEAEAEAEAKEAEHAAKVAREGAERGRSDGWRAADRVERAEEGLAKAIIDVAAELDARLIVCGSRGRGAVRSAVLGSVSHALVTAADRPVLVAPEGG